MNHIKIINDEKQKELLEELKKNIKNLNAEYSKDDIEKGFRLSFLYNKFREKTEMNCFVFFLSQEFYLIEIDHFNMAYNDIDSVEDLIKKIYQNQKEVILLDDFCREFVDDRYFKNQKRRLETINKTFYEVNHIYKYRNKNKAITSKVSIDELMNNLNLHQKKEEAINYLKTIDKKHLIDSVQTLYRYNENGIIENEKILRTIDELIINLKKQ